MPSRPHTKHNESSQSTIVSRRPPTFKSYSIASCRPTTSPETPEFVLNRPTRLEGQCVIDNEISHLEESPSERTENDNEIVDISPIEKQNDAQRQKLLLKKEKYFSEKQEKNFFKKLLYPSYQVRNTQFKKLFVDTGYIDKEELFLTSYSCAVQRDILCHGRMYLSQSHICFHSMIVNWETRLVIPYVDIERITRQRAAMVFPNSIQIEKTDGEKFFFASFVSRNKSLNVIQTVCDIVKAGSTITPQQLWEKFNIEDKNSPILSPASAATTESFAQKMVGKELDGDEDNVQSDKSSQASEPEGEASCNCAEHRGKLLLDCVLPVPIRTAFELLFTDCTWFLGFNEKLRNKNYVSSVWITNNDGDETRTCTYTVALNHAMAPKSCIINETQTIHHLPNPLDGFVVMKKTQNDLPYSDAFSVECSYCITRVNAEMCRIRVHGGMMLSKTLWLIVRGYIEKSTNQGLYDHYTLLEKMIRVEAARLYDLRDTESFFVEGSTRPLYLPPLEQNGNGASAVISARVEDDHLDADTASTASMADESISQIIYKRFLASGFSDSVLGLYSDNGGYLKITAFLLLIFFIYNCSSIFNQPTIVYSPDESLTTMSQAINELSAQVRVLQIEVGRLLKYQQRNEL